MSAARRGRLHLRLGAHLAATGGAPAEVARHLLAAAPEGDPAERALWARRAADLAVGVVAYDRAADLLRRALGPDLPPAAASAVHEGLGVALDRLGRRDEARAAFLAAADHARTAGDTDLLARAALGHAGYAVAIGAPDPVTVALLEEVRAASPPPAPALHARVCAALATERYYPDRDEADRLSREALDRAPDDATRAHVLSARHVVLWRADGAHERLAVADRMRDLALASGDPLAELQARNWRVIDLMELTRIGEAEEEIAAYAALAGRLRLPRHGWYVPLWRAAIAIVRGDLDAADALNREAAEAGAGSGDPNAEGHVWIQRHLILMEGDRVAEIDLDAIMHRARRSPTGMGAWLGWLGMMYARAGDMDTAGALLDELARDGFAQLPDDANWHAACEAADVCARVGAAGHARTLVPRLAPYAGLTPVVARGVGVYPPVALHLGRLHRLLGETAASEAALDRAEAIAVRLGATPWLRAVAEVRAAVP